MSDPSALLSVVLGVLTLVSVVASAVAVARATLAKTTIDTLRSSNDALVERVGLLEADNVRQATRLAALTAENLALQTYVNGTDAVKDLGATLALSDHARQTEHHDILAAVQMLPMIVTANHDEVMSLIRGTLHNHGGTA